MILPREGTMRTIVAVIPMLFPAAPAAWAQSYFASGHIGYLQEWEITGNLARTVTRLGADYSGAITLRHVGLCSVNGVEQKQAHVQLNVSSAHWKACWSWTTINAASSHLHHRARAC